MNISFVSRVLGAFSRSGDGRARIQVVRRDEAMKQAKGRVTE
jgi:hypothetical protein